MTFDPASNQAAAGGRKKKTPEANGAAIEPTPEVDVINVDAPGGSVADAKEIAEHLAKVALVELPIHCHHAGYASNSVEATNMTRRQAGALNVLWSSLSDRGARCQNNRSRHPKGTVVETGPDVIRYLLDQVADAVEKATGKDLTADFGFEFSR